MQYNNAFVVFITGKPYMLYLIYYPYECKLSMWYTLKYKVKLFILLIVQKYMYNKHNPWAEGILSWELRITPGGVPFTLAEVYK